MGEFDGQVAVVTGATSGIGRATALRLARGGANLVLVGRRAERLREVNAETRSETGREALEITADVTGQTDAKRIVATAAQHFGAIHILVNAAGVLAAGSLENTTLDAWDAMMNVNLRAVFHLMSLAVPHLAATRGNIVNVSSVVGLRSFPNILAYCVSKAALDQLTRCAALELAPKGVRVNAVNPGVVETEMHRSGGMPQASFEQFMERSRMTHPLGRVGQVEEIAELIAYLASGKASWITGATYSIDGGRGLTCLR